MKRAVASIAAEKVATAATRRTEVVVLRELVDESVRVHISW